MVLALKNRLRQLIKLEKPDVLHAHSPALNGLAALWAQGDWVIKGVAILLLLMSVASWSVIIWRSLQLWRLRPANNASRDFWHAQSFAEGLQLLQPGSSASPYRMLAEEGQAAVDHHRLHKADGNNLGNALSRRSSRWDIAWDAPP